MFYYYGGVNMKITYWSDYACPYCYIGEARLKRVLSEIPELTDVKIEMRAFQLDPRAELHAVSDTQSRFARKYGISMQEAGETIAHISELGKKEGLDFKYASTLFTNTMDAHRLTKLAQSKGDPALAERVIESLFKAYFTENRELADVKLLQQIGEECGLPAHEVQEMLSTAQYEDEVIADEREAYNYGIHAVPYFVIGSYRVPGAQSAEQLKSVVLRALKDEGKQIIAEGASCGINGCP